jgi:hypothetical protein
MEGSNAFLTCRRIASSGGLVLVVETAFSLAKGLVIAVCVGAKVW